MAGQSRLGYVDWARGLCVVLMFHMHAFFAWVRPSEHGRPAFGYTRLMAGFTSTMFLFLAGLGVGLLAESLWRKGSGARGVVGEGVRRGLEILGYAYLFRLWMFASSRFYRPADLLRVDVLNCIGIGLVMVAAVAFGWRRRGARIAAALAVAIAVAVLTPLAWDSGWATRLLPLSVAGYVSGRVPDAYFPLFPWSAYVAAGAATAFLLSWARERGYERRFLVGLCLAGAALMPLGLWLDRTLPWLYPRYDFWYTSPHYTLLKVGVALLVLGLSPLADALPGAGVVRMLGRTSLLMYWVHLEIVYGLFITPRARSALTVEQAAVGVVALTLVMIVVAFVRTRGPHWYRSWRARGSPPPGAVLGPAQALESSASRESPAASSTAS